MTEPAKPLAEGGLLRGVDAIAEAVVVFALIGELVVVLANVSARVFFITRFFGRTRSRG